MWSAYVVHLPFYLVHPFNSDPLGLYQSLFRSHWQAEWAYYNSSAYFAGDDGRYGLGAGPVDPSCADGSGYVADLFCSGPSCATAKGDHCRIYSPYSLAGYLPASPTLIKSHLLALLASGESVYPLPAVTPVFATRATAGNDDDDPPFVLWRKSLIHPGWKSDPPATYTGVTMVDASSELFGLSTIWLGAGFYRNNTDHWPAAQQQQAL